MTDPARAAVAASAPRPRRTRRGEVVVGPTLRARYVPGALIGLPIVSLVLTPLGTAGVEQLLTSPTLATHPWAWSVVRTPLAASLVAFVVLWVLLALWALLPMLLTRRVVLLDERGGTLCRRRGIWPRQPSRPVSHVVWAVGEAQRDAIGAVGLLPPGAGAQAEVERWTISHIGWDASSFDGLRALQEQAGLTVAPPRSELLGRDHRRVQVRAHRELADRVGMPWREEYATDPAAFQRDFDHARRVLGGKERPRQGDGRPGSGDSPVSSRSEGPERSVSSR